MNVRDLFIKKIYKEMQMFQRKSKTDATENSQKNEIFKALYNILLDVADDFSEKLLSELVNQGINILESLYSNLISCAAEESFDEDLKAYVKKEIEDYETEEYGWWNNPEFMDGGYIDA